MEGGWSQQDENGKRNVIQLQAKQARIEDHEKETRGQPGRWSQLKVIPSAPRRPVS
jgi:hypothetical protein